MWETSHSLHVPSKEAESRAAWMRGWKSRKLMGPSCPICWESGKPLSASCSTALKIFNTRLSLAVPRKVAERSVKQHCLFLATIRSAQR